MINLKRSGIVLNIFQVIRRVEPVGTTGSDNNLTKKIKKNKKGIDFVVGCVAYARFLRSNMFARPTKTITMIMATIPGTMYVSATDCASGVGIGVDVGPLATVR
jgi:hypothetical protein